MLTCTPGIKTDNFVQSANYNALSKVLLPIEKWVVYAYAASLPLTMTGSWVIFIVGLVLRSLLICSDAQVRRESLASIKEAPLTVPLLLFATAIAVSGAFNSQPEYGQLGAGAFSEAWQSLATLKNIVPYFWAAIVIRKNAAQCKNALLLLLLVSAIAGIWGTIQQIFNIHPGYKYLQGTGFLGGPMAFAGQMQLFSLLSLALFLTGAFKQKSTVEVTKEPRGASEPNASDRLARALSPVSNPLFFGVIVVANYCGVLFAGERSAWLGAFMGTAAVCWIYWRKLPLKIVLPALLAIVLCVTCVPLVKTRFQTLLSGKDVSITARQTIWNACLSLIPKSPVVGVGIRRFPHFDIPEAIVPGVSKDLNHAHSNYFHILTTTGFLGLGCYMLMVGCFFRHAFLRLKSARLSGDSLSCALSIGMIGALISLLVSGIFEYNFGTAQVRLAQWFLFGAL